MAGAHRGDGPGARAELAEIISALDLTELLAAQRHLTETIRERLGGAALAPAGCRDAVTGGFCPALPGAWQERLGHAQR